MLLFELFLYSDLKRSVDHGLCSAELFNCKSLLFYIIFENLYDSQFCHTNEFKITKINNHWQSTIIDGNHAFLFEMRLIGNILFIKKLFSHGNKEIFHGTNRINNVSFLPMYACSQYGRALLNSRSIFSKKSVL